MGIIITMATKTTGVIRGLTHYFAEGRTRLSTSCPPMDTAQERANKPAQKMSSQRLEYLNSIMYR